MNPNQHNHEPHEPHHQTNRKEQPMSTGKKEALSHLILDSHTLIGDLYRQGNEHPNTDDFVSMIEECLLNLGQTLALSILEHEPYDKANMYGDTVDLISGIKQALREHNLILVTQGEVERLAASQVSR